MTYVRRAFRYRRFLMLLLLLGAFATAFSRSGSFTNTAFSQSYGSGGNYYCPSPMGCGNFGCHARSIADPTQICSQYPIMFGASCPSPINCRATSF
jgi:hypothetical protein